MSDTQHQVNVRVDTPYLPEQTAPEQNRIAFAYTVTIENQGVLPPQPLSRQRFLTDGARRTQEVRGG
ncbi:ApaG domain, partial [Pseudomonas aeruginosa]|uniref:ApaG domain-containing protein n=1 Tax=Pseudomonas aeruginosa TaxID=287 RepID=UPI003CC6AAC1